jgi:hypothetical protein
MLIDMIYDHHGEPGLKTRYRNPALLRTMGYEAIVIPGALMAIPGARDDRPDASAAPAASLHTTRKPAEMEASIDAHVAAALAQGMKVFFHGDAILLPRHLVALHPEWLCEDGSGRLCAGKDAVYAAVQDQVHELFDRWPAAAGLVMRTGDVFPDAAPGMVGTALYAGIGSACPMCRGLSLLDRLIHFITCMYEAVILEQHKLYVHRAWQMPSLGLPSIHDDVAVYRELSNRLPASPHLAFSFKFTHGAMGRPETLNPCLLADDRLKWIEFQSEREFEGKGAFPNYQAAAWRELFGHLRVAVGPDASPESLRTRFGIWGWSRGGNGGGWGGPYLQREEWIDANVRALATLYRRPESDPAELATAWAAETFGIAESSPPAPAIAELLVISSATLRKLLYVAALDEGRNGPQVPFLRDDLLDVEALWLAAGRIVDAGAAAEAIMEKQEALDGVDRMRRLFDIATPDLPNKMQARDLGNTLAFFSSLAGTLAQLLLGFIRFHQWNQGGRLDAELADQCKRNLEAAQTHWQQHGQHALLPGAPSVFHENTLWQRTNGCLSVIEEE